MGEPPYPLASNYQLPTSSGLLIGNVLPSPLPSPHENLAPSPAPLPPQEAMSPLLDQPRVPVHGVPRSAADRRAQQRGVGRDARLGNQICSGALCGREAGRGREGDSGSVGDEGCECPGTLSAGRGCVSAGLGTHRWAEVRTVRRAKRAVRQRAFMAAACPGRECGLRFARQRLNVAMMSR